VEPIVWKVDEAPGLKGGIYGTPGINGNVVYVATNGGKLVAVDRTTGAILWEQRLPPPTWGSPVIVDDTLLIGDCLGNFHAFDVSDPLHAPPEKWSIHLGGCIEATPAVWEGRIYIGTRAGHLYILGDSDLGSPAP
jgi:outer membrane protein assembly factor BamB